MKFYTSFIMRGSSKSGQPSPGQGTSTMAQIERLFSEMYSCFSVVQTEIEQQGKDTTQHLLDMFSFSQSYAELHKILINCIEDYGESIMSLFGIDHLLIFLQQIDKLSKEKGTQIIEHFYVSMEVDRVAAPFMSIGNANYKFEEMTPKTEYGVDLLCEEISNFSYYYEKYRIYVLNFLYKIMGFSELSGPPGSE